jgi:predicted O-methyltransferase YrrM
LGVEAHLGHRFRAGARRFNRVRWASKLSNVRRAPPGGTAGTLDKLSYVLWAPELGDHSFDVADPEQVAAVLARALPVTEKEALAALDEVARDEQLHEDYARLRRLSLVPRRMRLGPRLLWWAVVRLRKPRLVVETGVWYGLGSAALLRALELNAAEGHDGRLISFDPDSTGGWLVPERLQPRWNWVKARTDEALEPLLSGEHVDLFIHDTPSNYARERAEFEVALRHAAQGAVLISSNGQNTPALAELSAVEGLAYHHLPYVARRHFYVTKGLSLAVVSRKPDA